MNIAAIIPAHNEARTIGNIVYALRRSACFSEIILVSDGSTDRTAAVARRCGARVISLSESLGKGGALSVGVASTSAETLLFVDGDLLGFTQEHIQSLLDPIERNEAVMAVGILDRGDLMFEITQRLPLLSGQRAMRREIFDRVPQDLRKGFQIEEAINYLCKVNNETVAVVHLAGLSQIQKVEKRGLVAGAWGYVKMAAQVAKVMVMMRVLRLVRAI